MISVTVILGSALFLSCLYFCLLRGRKRGTVTLLEWGILSVGLIYGLGWALVIVFTSDGYNPLWEDRILPFENYFLLHNFLAFVLAICIIAGWFIFPRPSRLGGRFSAAYLSSTPERLHLYAWLLFAISFILRWIYVQAFGGFVGYLQYSAAIRSAIFEVQNQWSFLQPFSGVAVFSTFLFFSSLLEGKKTAVKIIGFVLSLGFSGYILYSLLGRIGFLVFVSTIFLSVTYVRKIKPRLLMFGGLLGASAMIILAYMISEILDLKGATSIQEYISRELCFPFVSFFSQLEAGKYLYLWYRDFIFSPLYLLPSSWWGQWVDEVSQINTLVVMGARKGDSGITGAIPVDLVTLGVMQMSVFGVVGVGVLFGAMLRFLQGLIDGITSNGFRAVLWAYLSIQVAILAVAYAQPHHLITGLFGALFSMLLLSVFSAFGKVRLGG